jgi:hypothetical protein
MKKLICTVICFAALSVVAQKKTTQKCGWIKETQTYYAKSGRDMDYTDTLELVPMNKAWQLCCLCLTPDYDKTWLFDVGIYRERQQQVYTLKGGVGAYVKQWNTIITADYHRTIGLKAQAFGLNVLKQGPEVVLSNTTVRFYPLRFGFNAGAYQPQDAAYRPYIEPKLGLVMPFGRGHIYASYRFIAGNSETYGATKGWNFGSTTLIGW